jgi:probable F420-dependent oxidoreductase
VSKLDLGRAGTALTVSDTWLDEAAELEQLGYSTLWLPGGQIGNLGRLASLVAATTTVRVVPAIIPLDVYSPELVAGLSAQLEATAPGRFVAGLGGPQQPRPLRALNAVLDYLDHADPPVPAGRRLLAALGPRKLALARDRSAGAILLLVTPAYVSVARQLLGGDRTLVVDAMVVLDDDPARARETARRPVSFLSCLPGYRASFARMGFADADISAASDTLVDQVVIWGDAGKVAARIGEYTDAGADHVMLHVLHSEGQPGPAEAARELAGRLLG